MKLIVCVDTRGGILFGARRVSSDYVVCQRILELCDGELWMAPYSRPLFPKDADIRSDEKYLEKAGNAWCFVETNGLTSVIMKASQIVIFCWNRTYPFDLRFPMEMLKAEWELAYAEEFPGKSHDRITMEVYEKCEKSG